MPKPYRQTLHTLEQTVTATDQFDGTVPALGLDAAAEAAKPFSRVWVDDDGGGIFDWNLIAVNPGRGGVANKNYVRVKQVSLFSAANFDYVLSVTDGTLSGVWLSANGVQSLFSSTELVLPPGWYLSLVTANGTATITAAVTGVPEEIGR
jgi:hypothetical protein